MTHAGDQNSQELRSHIRMLQNTPGWYHPLVDRLFKEILEQDKKIEKLEKRVSDYGWAAEASRQSWVESESERCSWK